MGLYVSGRSLPGAQHPVAPQEGSWRIQLVFGADQSLMIALRQPGFRSRPHIHDCEELIYLVEGELWCYVEEKGYRVRRGDFLRIPRMAVHWERNVSDRPCGAVHGHCPALDPLTCRHAFGLFGEREDPALRSMGRTIPVSDEYTRIEEKIAAPEMGGLYGRGEDVAGVRQAMHVKGGALSTKFVYGHELNFMVGIRPGGYHSHPHFHACEQVNYMTEGEIWIFIEDRAFHLSRGDFLRIPRMAVHWAWNRADSPCVLYETHAPPLDPRTIRGAVGLFEEGEASHPPKCARNIFTPDISAEVEAKYP